MISNPSVTRFTVDVTVDSEEVRIIFPGGGYIPISAHRIKDCGTDTAAIGQALVSLVRAAVHNAIVGLSDKYGRPAELVLGDVAEDFDHA